MKRFSRGGAGIGRREDTPPADRSHNNDDDGLTDAPVGPCKSRDINHGGQSGRDAIIIFIIIIIITTTTAIMTTVNTIFAGRPFSNSYRPAASHGTARSDPHADLQESLSAVASAGENHTVPTVGRPAPGEVTAARSHASRLTARARVPSDRFRDARACTRF